MELGQSLHPTTMEIKVGGLFTFSSEKPAAPKRVTEGNLTVTWQMSEGRLIQEILAR